MEIIQLLILASLFLFTFLKLIKTKKSIQNLPPGPWRLPLIGNMHHLIGFSVPHRALQALSLKYGPLMHLQLGELSAVVVSSPEAAKEVMKTHDINFASRPSIIAAEIMSYGFTTITFSPYGDYWRQLRKICALELLSAKRVKSFGSIREEVFSDVSRWIACNEGSTINLTEKFYSSTNDVVSRAAFGKKTKEQEKLLQILEEFFKLGSGFDIAELYPSSKLLKITSRTRRKLTKLQLEADRIVDGIIREHKAANAEISDEGESKQQHEEDLVDVLLKFQDEGLQIPLTTENIKAVILDIMAAGSETSSTTMDWAMAEMLKNPKVLERAQHEVRQVYDEKGYVDESNIHQLKYLKSVVKETLRLHPPVPLLLPRKCREKCEIDGYEIPENTKVIVNAWAINRDPKYWKNAESFEPERFLDNLVDHYKGNCFEYIPFGAGRRMCPGISFGLASVELPLAMFLYHFEWNLPGKNDEVYMGETFGVTAKREKGLYAVPVIKRPLPVQ